MGASRPPADYGVLSQFTERQLRAIRGTRLRYDWGQSVPVAWLAP